MPDAIVVMVAQLNLILITMFDAVTVCVCVRMAMWIYDCRLVFGGEWRWWRVNAVFAAMDGSVWLGLVGWILVRWVVSVELVFGLAQLCNKSSTANEEAIFAQSAENK